MRDTFIASLSELAAIDDRLMLITGDLGFGVLTDYAKNFPRQFLNAGVAEQNMTGIATGLAAEGRVVFTYSIANFPILRCLEQIRNDAAYHDVNVNVVSIGGGFSYGALGMSHHATEDLAIMRALPQVTVFSPSCLWEVQQITQQAINTPGVCYLRLDKSHPGSTENLSDQFTLGVPRQLQEGDDITVATTGGVLGEVLKACEQIGDSGFKADVFSVHTLKPARLDRLLDSIHRTGALLIVEEHVDRGGLAGLISEGLFDAGFLPEKSARVGITGGYCSTVGSQDYLRRQFGLDSEALSMKMLAMLQG